MARAEERRRSSRRAIVLKVAYGDPRELLSDYITNLAEGGMFFRTDLDLAVGQHISCALSFPGLLEPFQCSGIVRWRRRDHASLEDPPGVGVEFVFADHADRERTRLFFERLFAAAPETPGPAFRVLLVETNAFAAELFSHAVQRFHAEQGAESALEIIHENNGRAALERLEREPFDLAIVNHFLPGLSGCEVVRQLRGAARTRELPVVVISTGGERARREAYRAGADLFLEKPLAERQLVDTLFTLLRARP